VEAKRRRRLQESAIDQLERLLELAQKATGKLTLPLLKDSEKLRKRLRSNFKVFGYPADDLERVIHDIVEFHEACRKFLEIVENALDTRLHSDPGLVSLRLGNAVARLGDWETCLSRMSMSLVRFRNFLSGKAAIQDKKLRKGSSKKGGLR
jgi:hypothetical protein